MQFILCQVFKKWRMLQFKAFSVVDTEELFKLVLNYCMASIKMYLQNERIATA